MTDEQIKTWSDAAQAQLKVQQEAMKAGTFVPGMGGMRGGHGGHVWRGSAAPSTSTTPTASNSTVN
ncbi:hypothetical protein [Desulfosporosinus sp. Sb-LF]|uniref:hypothetical protein n=1 Tax=Desulfosporosinus sp. Sb-LF TaxID=2560027 RepID=UPI0032B7C872